MVTFKFETRVTRRSLPCEAAVTSREKQVQRPGREQRGMWLEKKRRRKHQWDDACELGRGAYGGSWNCAKEVAFILNLIGSPRRFSGQNDMTCFVFLRDTLAVIGRVSGMVRES